ncbi:MAG: hypothetical protein J1E64_13035 [Acetatifactor sp.]|nr:hypothetical protein [Acetatifactor sp.]
MTKSKFYEDKRKEELFGVWLDAHFYVTLIGKYKSISRNTDEALQKKGVDVIIETKDGKTIYIDEKATLQYINKHIPTFAFEIKNTTSGARGWLFNPEYITDHYLLAWPNAFDENIPSAESFTDTEIMIIKRESVIQLLADNGITENKILELIEHYKSRLSETNRFEISPGITLNFNLSLAECPINVVIKKDLLKKYANYHTVVK